jgi:hypothetical protein
MLIFAEAVFAVKTRLLPSLIGEMTQFLEDDEAFEA